MSDRFLGAGLVAAAPRAGGWMSLYAHPGGATTLGFGPLPGVNVDVRPGRTYEDIHEAAAALRALAARHLGAHGADRPAVGTFTAAHLRRVVEHAGRAAHGPPGPVDEGPATIRDSRLAQRPDGA